MGLSNAEIGAIAAALGHTAPAVHATPGGRYFGTCSCGYKSTTRTTFALATDALIHHVLKVVKAARSDGVSLPGSVAARL